MTYLRLLLIVAMITGSATLSGCGIKPWVKPYERANLADPIMSFARDPVAESYKNHVHQAREGARGAESGAGGGCGCN
ncbi:MAG: hypothetical protein AMJ55_09335 [Gammaproteobacteria bacterium SG8_15]|nr:MAG: hypothetical protein AMJ55_09335 [Gammaproteobacteria bacterium SG8_15]